MKVLNVMTSGLEYNGIGMSVLNYFRNIDENKIHIDFVVPNIVDDKIRGEVEGKNGKIFEMVYKGKRLRDKKPLEYCKKLYNILKQENYDAVHVHGSSAMLVMEMIIAKKAGCKIRIVHSRNTKSNFPLIHNICKPFFKNSYTDAFACGKEAGEWLFGKDAKVTVIPNGKDLDFFKYNEKVRNEYRKKYNLEDKIVIGHVGNFSYQKNHEYLIDVFYNLSLKSDKYYLILAGSGNLQDEIKEKVKKLGIENKVLFIGRVSNIVEWIQAMDIMVFPSRFEGFPNVLIEWQIAGLPCIIADTITPDVKVTDLVQFKSIEDKPETWVSAIESIKLNDRNDTSHLKQIKDAGYDIKDNAKRLENIYLSLLNR